MSFITHIFVAIGMFIAGLFGIQPAVPAAPAAQVGPVDLSAGASSTTTPSKTPSGLKESVGTISFNGHPIVGADPASFGLISGSGGSSTDYSKDKNHVYLGTAIVLGADPASFTVLAGPLKDSADNVSIYYAKDAHHVFINDLVIANADPATFAYVAGNASYNAKDKNHKYLNGRIVQ